MKRFFLSRAVLETNFELTGPEHNHLTNVVRAHIGEQIIVCNGDDFDYIFEISKITKNSTHLRFLESTANSNNPIADITVFLALIKPDNFSLAVQKLNEIGVATIIPFKSAYSQNSINAEKMQIVAQQSCKQCGRSRPMKVESVCQIEEMIKKLGSFQTVIFADERESVKKIMEINFCGANKTALIIGPEGGFTEQERIEILKYAIPVSLGRRILRAETAAMVGAALIAAKLGEL